MFCVDLQIVIITIIIIIIIIIIIQEGSISTKYLIYIYEMPGMDPAHRLPVLTGVCGNPQCGLKSVEYTLKQVMSVLSEQHTGSTLTHLLSR